MRNKKGMEHAFITVALALITFILLVVLYNNIYGQGKLNIEKKLNCQGAFGIGYGECTNKDDCIAPSQAIASTDCKDEGATCCVSLEKPEELMPKEYGGSRETNFKVTYIGPKTIPPSCTKQNNNDYELVCSPGTPINLVIKIGIENTGTKPVDVSATPLVIDLSGALSPKMLDTGLPIRIESKKTGEPTVNYQIAGTGATVGKSYRIYPAAKCVTAECKKTNPNGIFKKLEGAYMNIAFIK